MFSRVSEGTEGINEGKGVKSWQLTSDFTGVAGIYGWREALTIAYHIKKSTLIDLYY